MKQAIWFAGDFFDEVFIKFRVFLRRRKMAKWRNETPNRLDLLPANPLDPTYNQTHEEWDREMTEGRAEIRRLLGKT